MMQHHSADNFDHGAVPTGPETRDADIGLVVKTSLGIFASVALCMVIAAWQMRFEAAHLPQDEPGNVFTQEGKVPPGPRLQAFPAKDLVEFKKHAANRAESYGWVDKPNGIAHVPVEKAIEMVLKNGLPVPAPKPAGAKPAEARKQ
jgi:hypothetical protein